MTRALVLALLSTAACAADAPQPPIGAPSGSGDPGDTCGGSFGAGSLVALAMTPTAVDQVVLVDAGTAKTCALATFVPPAALDGVTSLAAIDREVYYCAATASSATGALTRVALDSGAVTTAPVSCLSVTSVDGRLVVMTDVGSTVEVYATFADALAGRTDHMSIGDCAIRLGTDDAKIYSTWPSASSLFAYDPATARSSSVTLARGIANVGGVVARAGVVTILDAGASSDTLASFDAATGALAGDVAADASTGRLHGLAMVGGPPAI